MIKLHIYILTGTSTGLLSTDILLRNLDIKGIISLENNDKNKSSNEYYDYSKYCNEHQVELITVKNYNLNQEDIEKITKYIIDIIIVTGWQRLVPEIIIDYCKIGIIGAHGSSQGIQRGRGRSPQNWALILNEKKFYISLFWIDGGTDSGRIIDTEYFEYTEIDNIFTSYIKVNLKISEMIIKNIKNGNIQSAKGKEQEGEKTFYLPKRIEKDGQIDWNRTAKDIYNFIRALTKPYPGAYTKYKETIIQIWRAKYIICNDYIYADYQIGEVLNIFDNKSLLVKCAEGILLIEEYESEIDVKTGMCLDSCSYLHQMQEIVKRHNKNYSYEITPVIINEIKSLL